jgi:hypothetical protein
MYRVAVAKKSWLAEPVFIAPDLQHLETYRDSSVHALLFMTAAKGDFEMSRVSVYVCSSMPSPPALLGGLQGMFLVLCTKDMSVIFTRLKLLKVPVPHEVLPPLPAYQPKVMLLSAMPRQSRSTDIST